MIGILEDGDKVGITIVAFVLAFIGGCFVGMSVERDGWEEDCVRRGVGSYTPEREFEWGAAEDAPSGDFPAGDE